MKKFAKRLLALGIAGVMALSLAACGGGGSSAPAGSDSGSTGGGAAAGGEKITLIMSQRDEFLSSLEAGAKKAAGELGVNLVTQDANQDESKQIQYVQAAAADGQKAIIVNPINPSACQSIIDAAGDMKVVFVNRVPDDTSILNENAVYVGSDEHTSGKFARLTSSTSCSEVLKARLPQLFVPSPSSRHSRTMASMQPRPMQRAACMTVPRL